MYVVLLFSMPGVAIEFLNEAYSIHRKLYNIIVLDPVFVQTIGKWLILINISDVAKHFRTSMKSSNSSHLHNQIDTNSY